MTNHTRAIDRATDLPISVDLENGYGADPKSVALAIMRVAEAGAVGASIEDYDPSGRIYELEHAVQRIAAAADAAHGLGFQFTLTARSENLIRGVPDLDDTIARLQAHERAGADVLYAPGLRSTEDIRKVCEALSRPVNVLAMPDFTLAQAVGAGAQRISVGGRLGLVGVESIVKAAVAIRDEGDFSSQDVRLPLQEWLTNT